MIEIGKFLVSEDVIEECFCCDIKKCKGICCVEGDSGAPLSIHEADLLRDNFKKLKPFMTLAGIDAVELFGVAVVDRDGDLVTPLIDGKECAYSFVENGITLCAIERAFNAGKALVEKPISCALYPIRTVTLADGMIGINYDKWSICKDAVKCGKNKGLRVYQMLEAPISRAFGRKFFLELKAAAQLLDVSRGRVKKRVLTEEEQEEALLKKLEERKVAAKLEGDDFN